MPKKLALIDGSGFIFRAFHALPPLVNSKGLQTNAIFGFTRMVLSLIDNLDIDYVAVVFDKHRQNFRNDIYSEYKANRPDVPEELIYQFELIRESVAALNIEMLEKEGFEADDIIATYTDMADKQGLEVVIISSDKDLMQLIKSPKVYMYDPVKKKYIKEAEVMTKFGVTPDKLIYAQALIGDSTDNVPGVKGLGPKTAAKLINQYETLAGIYNNIESITSKDLKEKLLINKTSAFISLELVTLRKDVELNTPIESLQLKPLNPHVLYKFCKKLEFNSLVANIVSKYKLNPNEVEDKTDNSLEDLKDSEYLPNEDNSETTYKIINNANDLEDVIAKLSLTTNVYCYLENNHLALVGDDNEVYIIIINKQDSLISLFTEEVQPFSNITINKLKENIHILLINECVNKVLFNFKAFLELLKDLKLPHINAYDDIQIMSYVLDGPVRTDLESIVTNSLLYKISNVAPSLADNLPNDELKDVFQKVLAIKQVYAILKPRIVFEKSKFIYECIDKPLAKSLFYMENTGVLINPVILNELNTVINGELKQLQEQIFAITQKEFNINSPKQVGEMLYNTLNIKGKKNKSGSWKTNSLFLEELDNQGIAIAGLLLKWRKFSKLKTTYTEALPTYINLTNGRVHSTFLQNVTNTGRISSTEPNLQNIPIKSEIGSKIREAFIAAPGYKIISLDYSQIELKLLAHIANEPRLIEAFEKGEDIHVSTAKEVFKITDDQVNDEYRRKAKTINFGIIYGISEFGLAKRLHINNEEAKGYIDAYFAKFPKILDYMEDTKAEARKYGYVLTEFGRKCYVSNINSKNYAIKSFAERVAINAKLQGSAADIIRMCINKCFSYLKHSNIDANLVLQIHDELLLEAKEEIAEEVAKSILDIMQNICTLKVPLIVNYAIGNNWLEVH